MITLDGILGNINPETLDRQSLVRVMQVRDFHQFSPDLVERLTLRAEQEFGRHSPNKPVFDIHNWEKKTHIYYRTNRSAQQSYMERNLNLMARKRYFQWMNEYDVAARDGKAALMNNVVEDMRYWQGIYLDYLRYLGLPEPTLAELYQDFQQMIADFKVDASPEEIVLIDSFARDLTRILFASEVQRSIMNFFAPHK